MGNTLQSQLQQSGNSYAVLSNSQGGQLIILEKGARVLELKTAEEASSSAFWRDPNALHNENNWNSGGDRTWISPELEYFIDDSGSYHIPAQLDPGNWKLTQTTQSLAIANMSCELQHASSSQTIQVNLEKRFTLLPNPFPRNSSALTPDSSSVSYIGYEVRTDMNLTPVSSNSKPMDRTASPSGFCNLWSIMQVPPGGQIIAPTYGSIRPLTMFSQTENIDMELLPNGLRLHCEGQSSFKLSIDALSSTGRFGYSRVLADKKSSLVVRQFSVNPSGVYPDYPSNRKNYLGSCMQFYFDGGQLGHFAELEYHSPALSIDRPGHMTDTSQVFYFEGLTSAVQDIARVMLGICSSGT
ncbi:DUF6786 family protein [Cohnella silvisoli]|uniref:Uncharacterized protein n=1 Tax=Cohnella silvisoli TaxID=2873699 RepID=A0ABV1KX18_9BACL|nr:DUF6786 family protein [Cohnella silvisoli]MCD9023797.1 hypothetical protein [Cohnella silvisoli]